ncbi:hypothetical protein ACLB1G_18215 [Oxalobacteraceae bacterium A2-2]
MKELNCTEMLFVAGGMGSRGQVAPVDTPCANAVIGGAIGGSIAGSAGGAVGALLGALGGAIAGAIAAGQSCR